MRILISNRGTCKCAFKPYFSGFRQLGYKMPGGGGMGNMATWVASM